MEWSSVYQSEKVAIVENHKARERNFMSNNVIDFYISGDANKIVLWPGFYSGLTCYGMIIIRVEKNRSLLSFSSLKNVFDN